MDTTKAVKKMNKLFKHSLWSEFYSTNSMLVGYNGDTVCLIDVDEVFDITKKYTYSDISTGLLLNGEECTFDNGIIPCCEYNQILTCDAKILKDASKWTMKDTANKVLHSIYIKDNDIISCDGYRIYHNRGKCGEGETLLNIDTLDTLNNIETMIFASDKWNVIMQENMTLYTRRVEGMYLKIKTFFDMKYNKTIVCDTNQVKTFVKTILKDAKKTSQPIIFKNGGLDYKELHVDNVYTGDDITIAFNPVFIYEALKDIKDEQFTMEAIDKRSPVRIKYQDLEMIILPVNIK